MIFEYILHADATDAAGTSVLFGLPVVVGVVAAAATAALVLRAGWRVGFAAAVLGAVLLGAGLIGDLVSHRDHDRERREILTVMMEAPSAEFAHHLMELEGAETRNTWHLVSAAGQGLLVAGLAGAALVLWRRDRSAIAQGERASPPLRRVA